MTQLDTLVESTSNEMCINNPTVDKLETVVLAFENALQMLHANCDFIKDRAQLMRYARELMDTHTYASGPLREVIAAALDAQEL